MVGLTINGAPALVHGTGVQIVIPALAILGVPAFDHSAVGVIPHPLAGAVCVFGPVAGFGFLVYILVDGFSTLLHVIQPVPAVAGGVVNFFAAERSKEGVIAKQNSDHIKKIIKHYEIKKKVHANNIFVGT